MGHFRPCAVRFAARMLYPSPSVNGTGKENEKKSHLPACKPSRDMVYCLRSRDTREFIKGCGLQPPLGLVAEDSNMNTYNDNAEFSLARVCVLTMGFIITFAVIAVCRLACI